MKKSDINDLDKIFRNHFADSEVPVENPQALWNKIIVSRRKYRIIPFLFLGFLMSILTFSAYSNYKKDKNVIFENISNRITNPVDNENPNLVIEKVKLVNNKAFETLINEHLTNQNSGDVQAQDKLIGEAIYDYKIADDRQNFQAIDIRKEEIAIFDIQPKDNSSSLIDSNNLEFTNKADLKSSPLLIKDPVMEHLKENKGVTRTMAEIPNVEVTTSKVVFDELHVKNTMKKCQTEGKGWFYADVYTMAGVPIEKIELNDAFADQTAHRNAWEERYYTLPALTAGVRVGYESTAGIGFSIGAVYQRIETEYRTIQTITERVTIYDPMAYFYYDANNEVVWVGDSVTAVSTFDRTISLGNSFNLIHIPLEFSYILYNKARWKVSASAAAIFNFSLNYRGQYLRSDESLIQINQNNNDSYVAKNLGLGFEGSALLGYQLTNNWELYFGPSFRYNNNSYWAGTEAINSSRHFISFRTGLRYHF